MNFEIKRQMRFLKRIVRGLRLSLQMMNLSEEDKLVVKKLLRTARAQVKEFENDLTRSVNPPKPALTTSDIRVVAHQRTNQDPKNVVAAQFNKKRRKKQADNQRGSELPEEWKKPWNEVAGGSFGLGKSRKH